MEGDMWKIVAAGGLALGLVAGLSVAGIAPAAAAPSSFQAGADDPGPIPSGWASIGGKPYQLTPSSSKLRSYMINTLGKVLGKATPKAWQAEQLANQYRYNASWESVDAAVNGVPRWDPTSPSSYDDYVLAHAEAQFPGAAKGGTSGRAYAPPATKAGGLSKVVGAAGGAATALMGWSFGTAIGRGIDQLFGVDVDGTVCSSGASGLLSMVTGADCSAVSNTIPPDLQNYGVATGLVLSKSACDGSTGVCVTAGAEAVESFLGHTSNQRWMVDMCPTVTGTYPAAPYDEADRLKAFRLGSSSTNFEPMSLQGPVSYYCGGNRFYQSSLHASDGMAGFPTQAEAAAAAAAHPVVCVIGSSALVSGDCLTYSGTGTVASVSSADTNPDRHFTCTVTATDGTTYSADSPTFKESDKGLPVPICPQLPDGKVPGSMAVHEVGGGLNDLVAQQDTTDEYKAQRQQFPGCDEGACGLDLQVKDDTGTFTSCFLLDADTNPCQNWFKDPDRATKYQCLFGGQQVDISECFLYEGTFDPARRAAGAAYSDPNTGAWSGGQSTPTEGQAAMGSTVASPAGPRTCDVPQSSGFDPIAFVTRPVECALEWAWVPDPVRVQVSLAGSSQAWEQTTPAQVGAAIAAWRIAPSVSGCRTDISLPVPMVGKTITLPVIDTCPGSWMGSIAPWCAGIVVVVCGIGAAFACKRIIGSWVDYR